MVISLTLTGDNSAARSSKDVHSAFLQYLGDNIKYGAAITFIWTGNPGDIRFAQALKPTQTDRPRAHAH